MTDDANTTDTGDATISTTSFVATSDVRAYMRYPDVPLYSSNSRAITLYLPPPNVGGLLLLSETDRNGTIGFVRFDLDSATTSAEVKLVWSKDADGIPVAPNSLRFSPPYKVVVTPASGYHVCVFTKPGNTDAAWAWELVIDEPGYVLTVKVKRK